MKELILMARDGDKQAFTQLVIDLEDELYKIAKTRLENEYDILDAIQETMISAFKSIKSLKNPDYFKTWLIRILINKCNDIYKKRKNNILFTDYEEVLDSFSDNQNVSIDNELDFNSIIQFLNYDERIAITLYYMQGYTTKEISSILHVNENTLKTRIARAKNKIKEKFKGEYQYG